MSVARFPVEAGHVLTFARSLGDTSYVYSDASFAATGLAGVAAPPTFVQASAHFDPDYPLRPRPGEKWLGSPATEATQTNPDASAGGAVDDAQVLHAEQSYDFMRPVRVGDVLTSQTRVGKSWEKQGRRGGRLLFTELVTEYRDLTGELVVSATAVTVKTERVPGEEGQ